MPPERVSLLPPWLFVGLAAGAVASAVVAGTFVTGGRVFPERRVSHGPRVDGTGRRRHGIHDYPTATDERFVEDRPVRGEAVAFFLPDRGAAITLDAQAFFRLERTGVYVVLCEHEMPGGRLGWWFPFDVPDVEPELADLDDPVSAASDRLDLPATASSEAAQGAHRVRVRDVHPDRGGDRERFRELRKTYTMVREHAKG